MPEQFCLLFICVEDTAAAIFQFLFYRKAIREVFQGMTGHVSASMVGIKQLHGMAGDVGAWLFAFQTSFVLCVPWFLLLQVALGICLFKLEPLLCQISLISVLALWACFDWLRVLH